MNVALAPARLAPARTLGDLVVARIEAALDQFAADLPEASDLEDRLTAADAALAAAPEGAVRRRLIVLFRLDQVRSICSIACWRFRPVRLWQDAWAAGADPASMLRSTCSAIPTGRLSGRPLRCCYGA